MPGQPLLPGNAFLVCSSCVPTLPNPLRVLYVVCMLLHLPWFQVFISPSGWSREGAGVFLKHADFWLVPVERNTGVLLPWDQNPSGR